MQRRLMTCVLFAGALIVAAVASTIRQPAAERDAPDTVDLSEVQFEIVGALFVQKLDGGGLQFNVSEPDKYRGLVLTLKIKKPADKPLTLFVQDFSLHYYYGENSSDVAPCRGISAFSTAQGIDRPMRITRVGRGESRTGAGTIASDTVHVDLFFTFMEPDTRELHLLVAQPAMPAYATQGWQ